MLGIGGTIMFFYSLNKKERIEHTSNIQNNDAINDEIKKLKEQNIILNSELNRIEQDKNI